MIYAVPVLVAWLAYYFWPTRKVAGWYAGPVIRRWWGYRKNYSKAKLEPLPGGVLQCDLSKGIDALCRTVSSLPDSLTIEYELTGSVTPTDSPASLPLISVAFQRKGDNWNGEGKYQHYRWYAAASNVLTKDGGRLKVDFTSTAWGNTMGGAALDYPAEFAAAKADAGTLFITFGFSAGRSHGVSGDAQFRLWAVI